MAAVKRSCFTFIALLVAATPVSADERVLSPADTSAYGAAFAAMRAGKWDQAQAAGARASDRRLAKVIAWLNIARSGTTASFSETVAFINANPDWPDLKRLERRAEEALGPGHPRDAVLAWFAKREPRIVNGRAALADVYLETGRRNEAIALIRSAWIEGSFAAESRRGFLDRYGSHLRREDHVARFDWLLWDGRAGEAQGMYRSLGQDYERLALARIAFRQSTAGVDTALRKVPDNLQGDAGLAYERMRWRLRKGRDDEALQILRNPPKDLVRPDLWAVERQRLARRLLADGRASDAYKVAADHRTKPGTIHFTETEWLAGWIALRFLNDNAVALRHFERLHENVATPISRSRAAYWSGRAAEALKDTNKSQSWYAKAAQIPGTFYGVLAAEKIGQPATPPAEYAPTQTEMAAFRRSDLAQIVLQLAALGETEHLRPFLEHMAQTTDGPARPVLAARLAHEIGHRHLGVVTARTAQRHGHFLAVQGYPLLDLPTSGVDKALTHAIGRQESNFEATAVSSAGALGIMQLMPATARGVAKQQSIPYSPARLTSDPAYNVELGSAYVRGLLESFGGSYVLAIAAYNAGPANVGQWIRANGHPHRDNIDVIDWIESIPYNETRNFVQRVLENLQVYRHRIEGTRVARTIAQDLTR